MEFSLEDKRQMLQQKLRSQLSGPTIPLDSCPSPSPYIENLYDDKIIYELSGKLYEMSYTIGEDASITFGEPIEVVRRTVYDPAVKALAESIMNDKDLVTALKSLTDSIKGGSGSGNFGHSGRPGMIGGSGGGINMGGMPSHDGTPRRDIIHDRATNENVASRMTNFAREDWMKYAGTRSKNPLIARNLSASNWIESSGPNEPPVDSVDVVVDGGIVEVLGRDGSFLRRVKGGSDAALAFVSDIKVPIDIKNLVDLGLKPNNFTDEDLAKIKNYTK